MSNGAISFLFVSFGFINCYYEIPNEKKYSLYRTYDYNLITMGKIHRPTTLAVL